MKVVAEFLGTPQLTVIVCVQQRVFLAQLERADRVLLRPIVARSPRTSSQLRRKALVFERRRSRLPLPSIPHRSKEPLPARQRQDERDAAVAMLLLRQAWLNRSQDRHRREARCNRSRRAGDDPHGRGVLAVPVPAALLRQPHRSPSQGYAAYARP